MPVLSIATRIGDSASVQGATRNDRGPGGVRDSCLLLSSGGRRPEIRVPARCAFWRGPLPGFGGLSSCGALPWQKGSLLSSLVIRALILVTRPAGIFIPILQIRKQTWEVNPFSLSLPTRRRLETEISYSFCTWSPLPPTQQGQCSSLSEPRAP